MAADRESTTYWHLSQALVTRRGPQYVLRGKKLYKGALCFYHNGRAMPAASLDNSDTIAAGGPLNVAGADANGGLRFIARQPNVQIQIGAGTLRVQTTYSAGIWLVSVIMTAMSDTAVGVQQAILAHAKATSLIDVNYTGNGTTAPGTTSAVDVPFVCIAGICKRTIDNSSASTDLDITTTNFGPLEFDLGSPYMVGTSGSAPVAATVGGPVSITDDWSVSTLKAPLQIALPLVDFSPERGPAINLLAQPR